MIWLLGFLLSFSQASEVQSQCSGIDILKKNCAYLKENENKEFIALSNGEQWRNPLFSGNLESVDVAHAEALLKEEAAVQEILEEVSKTIPLSNQFKMAFARSGIGALTDPTRSNEQRAIYRLPLPPTSDTAPVQIVNREQVRQAIASFPEAQRLKLQNLSQKMRTRFDSVNAVYEQNSSRRLAKNRVTPENKQKVTATFEKTKQILESSIRRGRKDSALSPEELSLIRRVQTIRLNHGDRPSVDRPEYCGEDLPNAYYNFADHSVNLCSRSYSESSHYFAWVIGHEIGHSADPCLSLYPVVPNGQSWRINKHRDTPDMDYGKSIPTNRHPLHNVQQCMITKLGMRLLSKPQIQEAVAIQAKFKQTEEGFDDITAERLRKTWLREGLKEPACVQTHTHTSNINEAMSDFFGAMAIEGYLQEHPLKTEADRVAGAAFFLAKTCAQDGNIQLEALSEETELAHEHPSQLERFEKIFLQVPSVARSFNCSQNPNYQCSHQMLSEASKHRSGTGSSPKATVSPQQGTK